MLRRTSSSSLTSPGKLNNIANPLSTRHKKRNQKPQGRNKGTVQHRYSGNAYNRAPLQRRNEKSSEYETTDWYQYNSYSSDRPQSTSAMHVVKDNTAFLDCLDEQVNPVAQVSSRQTPTSTYMTCSENNWNSPYPQVHTAYSTYSTRASSYPSHYDRHNTTLAESISTQTQHAAYTTPFDHSRENIARQYYHKNEITATTHPSYWPTSGSLGTQGRHFNRQKYNSQSESWYSSRLCKFGINCTRFDCWFRHPLDMQTANSIKPSRNRAPQSSTSDKRIKSNEAVALQETSTRYQLDEKLSTSNDISTKILDETEVTKQRPSPDQIQQENVDPSLSGKEIKKLIESRCQIRKIIDAKNVKIQHLKSQLYQAKNRLTRGQEMATTLSHKLYLYSLLCQYHLSIFKDYVLNSQVTEEERNEVKFNTERLSSYTIHDLNLPTVREFLFLLLLKEDLLKPNEQEILDYSLNHRYLSYDISQFSASVDSTNKTGITAAIDNLLDEDEQEFFRKMFEKVFNSALMLTNASEPQAETEIKNSVFQESPSQTSALQSLLDSLIADNDDDEWDLHGKDLTNTDMITLCDMLKTNSYNCVTLDLRYNKISDAGAFELANLLTVNNTLQELLLNYNSITDDGLQHLCHVLSQKNNSIKVLYLNKNKITDIGAEAVAEMLKMNTTLINLSLAYNNISDRGIEKICDVLKFKNSTLRQMYIHGNKITDQSIDKIIDMISSNTTLQQIKLGKNHMSFEGKEKLHVAAETCKNNSKSILLVLE